MSETCEDAVECALTRAALPIRLDRYRSSVQTSMSPFVQFVAWMISQRDRTS